LLLKKSLIDAMTSLPIVDEVIVLIFS